MHNGLRESASSPARRRLWPNMVERMKIRRPRRTSCLWISTYYADRTLERRRCSTRSGHVQGVELLQDVKVDELRTWGAVPPTQVPGKPTGRRAHRGGRGRGRGITTRSISALAKSLEASGSSPIERQRCATSITRVAQTGMPDEQDHSACGLRAVWRRPRRDSAFRPCPGAAEGIVMLGLVLHRRLRRRGRPRSRHGSRARRSGMNIRQPSSTSPRRRDQGGQRHAARRGSHRPDERSTSSVLVLCVALALECQAQEDFQYFSGGTEDNLRCPLPRLLVPVGASPYTAAKTVVDTSCRPTQGEALAPLVADTPSAGPWKVRQGDRKDTDRSSAPTASPSRARFSNT